MVSDFGILNAIFDVIAATWWILIFVILFPLFRSTWLFWRQEKFKQSITWTLLELRIPREVHQSPKAMEQVLFALHSLRNSPGNFREYYINGEVTKSFSLEIVSLGGEIHYYIRVDAKLRHAVEAAIFSYYPDIEVAEADDYVIRFPGDISEMETQDYDLWGTEMTLKKEGAYPIRSYHDFEAVTEEREFDPASSFLEVLSKLKKDEIAGIQIIVAPLGNDWKDKFKPLVDELRATKMIKNDAGELVKAFAMRSPGETDVIKAIENNLSKPAFDTLIRLIYLAPKASFFDSYARGGIMGAFNQYGSLDLNMFAGNKNTGSKAGGWAWPYIFPGTRTLYRKQRLLHDYRVRTTPIDTWMGRLFTSSVFNPNFYSQRFPLTTESLATIYHPPMAMVLTAPHVKRVESRKAGPPAGLAIYGDESDLEKYF
jgi:hypothetical protein